MNTTITASPDEPDDSAEAIARLLNRQAALKHRVEKSMPPLPATTESETLQRQILDAESKKMLVNEELAAALRDALDKQPEETETRINDRLTVIADRFDSTVAHAEQSIRDAMPRCNEAGVRYLIHIYGLLLLLVVMGGFIFLVFTHR